MLQTGQQTNYKEPGDLRQEVQEDLRSTYHEEPGGFIQG